VDPVTRLRLQDEFLSIQRELRKTVVFVTHDVDEAIRLADRIAVVRAGQLVQYGAPEQILESPADPFVAAFVGADRALKRLSRFPVREYVKPAVSVRIDDETAMRRGGARFLWIVDPAGTLIGSLDTSLAARCGDLQDCISTENIREMAVPADASLKEALSRLLGELSLSDVEQASERQSGRASAGRP